MSDVRVEDSILLTIKKNLGLEPNVTAFDPDLIVFINSALNILTQLGAGPVEGFAITSEEEVWSQFIGDDPRLNMVKSYIYLKVRLAFDPPSIGAALSSYQDQIKEYEARINYQVDPPNAFD